MTVCKNCMNKLAHPESNFCSQECCDEWLLNQKMRTLSWFLERLQVNNANNGIT